MFINCEETDTGRKTAVKRIPSRGKESFKK